MKPIKYLPQSTLEKLPTPRLRNVLRVARIQLDWLTTSEPDAHAQYGEPVEDLWEMIQETRQYVQQLKELLATREHLPRKENRK
jgi:hypothetical protein